MDWLVHFVTHKPFYQIFNIEFCWKFIHWGPRSMCFTKKNIYVFTTICQRKWIWTNFKIILTLVKTTTTLTLNFTLNNGCYDFVANWISTRFEAPKKIVFTFFSTITYNKHNTCLRTFSLTSELLNEIEKELHQTWMFFFYAKHTYQNPQQTPTKPNFEKKNLNSWVPKKWL